MPKENSNTSNKRNTKSTPASKAINFDMIGTLLGAGLGGAGGYAVNKYLLGNNSGKSAAIATALGAALGGGGTAAVSMAANRKNKDNGYKTIKSTEDAAAFAGKYGMDKLREANPDYYDRVKDALERGEDPWSLDLISRAGEATGFYMGGSAINNLIRRGRIATDRSIAPAEDFNIVTETIGKNNKPKTVNKALSITKPVAIKDKLWDKAKSFGPFFGLSSKEKRAITDESWSKLTPSERMRVAESVFRGERDIKLTGGQISDVLGNKYRGYSMADLGTDKGREIIEDAINKANAANNLPPVNMRDFAELDRYRKIHGGYQKSVGFTGAMSDVKDVGKNIATAWKTGGNKMSSKLSAVGKYLMPVKHRIIPRLVASHRFLPLAGLLSGLGIAGAEMYNDRKYRRAYNNAVENRY